MLPRGSVIVSVHLFELCALVLPYVDSSLENTGATAASHPNQYGMFAQST